MGAEAAVNAVYANKIQSLEPNERTHFIAQKREEYNQNIDIYRLASEMIVDDIIQPNDLRAELIKRFEAYSSKKITFTNRKHGVYPV